MTGDDFKQACIDFTAQELTREQVRNDPGPNKAALWRKLSEEARPQAIDKINKMSNVELLELIGDALGRIRLA